MSSDKLDLTKKSFSKKRFPTVSVIIPLYNHEKFIKEAIESVLNQTFYDFEIIIINDGSTDNSENIVRDIKDDRIRYFYQENQGTHNAINRGIHLSQGEYISILNSDDVYHINRFEEILKILESDTSTYAVFSHIEFIDQEGNSIGFRSGAEYNWLGYNTETSFKGENNIILDLLAGNFLHTTSNLFCRKSVFDDIGYFVNLRYTHDYEFFLRLSYNYKVYIIERPLLKYRLHSSNTLSENYAESNFETGLVLANFLMNYDLKRLFSEDLIIKTMAKFFNSINTYDTDRMIMTLLFFGQMYNKRGNLWNLFSDPDNIFRKTCIDRFKKFRDMSLLKERILWQEGQTELWWRKAEELKNTLDWQKSQTNMWWRKAEELKNTLDWQKSQTNMWWRKAEQMSERASAPDSIQNSISWNLVSRLSKISNKVLILLIGSKRLNLLKGFLRKALLRGIK